MDTSGELGRNQVYQNIQVGGTFFVKCMQQAGYPSLNTLINAIENRDTEGIHSATGGAGTIGSGWRIHNKIY
jgi:hypothetical protein